MFVNYLVLIVCYLKKVCLFVHSTKFVQNIKTIGCLQIFIWLNITMLPFQFSHFVWLDINILHVGSSTWIRKTHSRMDFCRTTCRVAPLKWHYIYACFPQWYTYYQYYVIAISDDFSSHFRAWNLKVQTWCFHTKSYVIRKKLFGLVLTGWVRFKKTTIQMVTNIQSNKNEVQAGTPF